MSELKFYHVVARAIDGSIGDDGELLCSSPEDMKFFKTLTSRHICIVGRKTYEYIGRVLPTRIFIVISKTPHVDDKSLFWVSSIEDALEKARNLAKFADGDSSRRAFIIGGGEIYKQTFDVVSGLYITNFRQHMPGDTHYFPRADFNRRALLHDNPDCSISHIIELYTRDVDAVDPVFLGA